MSDIDSNYHMILKSLSDEPEEQAALALELLKIGDDRQLTLESLRVLRDVAYPSARSTLVDSYQQFAINGGKKDPGGQIRALIIHALGAIAHPGDGYIFENAALTYEFLPPAFREEAGPLRAAGIIALTEIDDESASFHASRLLVETYTDPMSGEPAVTAARVLASQGQEQALYQYLYQEPAVALPEITSECLRLLTSLPESLIPGLLDRFIDSENDLILAGLFELLVCHRAGPLSQDIILTFLKESDRYDVFRYVVALIVAESRNKLLPALLPDFRAESDKEKAAVLVELLAPLDSDSEINEIIVKLKRIVR